MEKRMFLSPRKETKRMIQELSNLLNNELKERLEETAECLLQLSPADIRINRGLIRHIAEETIIEIPIARYLTRDKDINKFSDVELDTINKAREIKRECNLTQEELAQLLNVSLRTVANWLTMKSGPHKLARNKISKVFDVLKEINGVVKPQALRRWLFADNNLLGDRVFNLLEKGEFEKIVSDIRALKEGVFM